MNAKDIAFSVIGAGMFAVIFFLVRGPSQADIAEVTSGVMGNVLLGPTCPVESIPPVSECGAKPYATTVTATNVQDGAISSTVATNADGNFSIPLAPGTYTLLPEGGVVFPACAEVVAEVVADVYTHIDLPCDTGIR